MLAAKWKVRVGFCKLPTTANLEARDGHWAEAGRLDRGQGGGGFPTKLKSHPRFS